MLKNKILEILDLNREHIKNMFDIDDDGVDSIRELLNKDRESFKHVINDISSSNIGNREKIVAYFIIGYANGSRKRSMKKEF